MALCGNNYKILLSEGVFMYSSAVSGFVVCKGMHKQKVLKEESIDCKAKVCSGRIFYAVCGEGMKRDSLVWSPTVGCNYIPLLGI